MDQPDTWTDLSHPWPITGQPRQLPTGWGHAMDTRDQARAKQEAQRASCSPGCHLGPWKGHGWRSPPQTPVLGQGSSQADEAPASDRDLLCRAPHPRDGGSLEPPKRCPSEREMPVPRHVATSENGAWSDLPRPLAESAAARGTLPLHPAPAGALPLEATAGPLCADTTGRRRWAQAGRVPGPSSHGLAVPWAVHFPSLSSFQPPGSASPTSGAETWHPRQGSRHPQTTG